MISQCLVPSLFTRYRERTPVGTSTPFFILYQTVSKEVKSFCFACLTHTKKSQLHIPFNFGSFLRHFTLQFNSLVHCGFYRLQLFHYVHRQFYIGPKEYIIKSLAGSVQESQHLSVLSRFEHEIVGWTHLSQTVQWCTSLLLQRLSRQHHRLSDSC